MKTTLLLVISLTCLSPLFAQKYWSFELMGGAVYNYPLPLVIEQKGFPDIRINQAIFATEPWISPYYWDWRFTRAIKNHSFEFEGIHHKLFLRNRPAEVERFGISHGFNMLFFNYGIIYNKYIFKTGLAPVLLHPESTVRGMIYEEGPGFDIKGYRLRGMALQMAVARQFRLTNTFFINTETKIIIGFANSPVASGTARVRNLSFQFVFGPGGKWGRRWD